MHRGSCLCGAVQFTIDGPLPAPNACHCTMCRKQSGHYWASTDVLRSSLTLLDPGAVSWYASSEKVRRGFCATCGSFLLWDAIRRDTIAVAMGSLDTPTQTRLREHIFVSGKGDYYDLTDGLPCNEH